MHIRALTLSLCIPALSLPNSQGSPPPIATSYEPCPAFPFGRLNPKAPPETKQFSFMIGEFDCVDAFRQPDGSWLETKAIWNAAYFLNGHAIQDKYWNPRIATSNLRVFDSKSGLWKVTFFKMPGYSSGVWSGEKEGDKLVMRQQTKGPDGKPRESRLTFYDITKDGFRWVGESVQGGQANAFWKSTARRRR